MRDGLFNNALRLALAPVAQRIDETTREIEKRAQELERSEKIPRAVALCVLREYVTCHARNVSALDAWPRVVEMIVAARADSRRYIVWTDAHALTCFDCAKTTHNPNDARFRFCPVHKFLDDDRVPPTGRAA